MALFQTLPGAVASMNDRLLEWYDPSRQVTELTWDDSIQAPRYTTWVTPLGVKAMINSVGTHRHTLVVIPAWWPVGGWVVNVGVVHSTRTSWSNRRMYLARECTRPGTVTRYEMLICELIETLESRDTTLKMIGRALLNQPPPLWDWRTDYRTRFVTASASSQASSPASP